MRARDVLFSVLFVLGLLIVPGQIPKAGEGTVKAEQLLPEKTLAAVFLPDLSSARAGWAKTPMARLYAQPEMQAFLKLPCRRLKEAYEELRQTNPLVPAWSDLDSGVLSGEMAAGIYPREEAGPPAGLLLTLKPKDPAAFLRTLPGEFRQALLTGELVPLGPPQGQAPAMVWKKQRLVLCFPQEDAKAVLARLETPAAQGTLAQAPGFTKARAALTHSAAFLYVD